MDKKSPLMFSTQDVNGYRPDPALKGEKIRHSGNGKVYVIQGFAWMGATDEWGFVHFAEGEMGPALCRPMSHLDGARGDGSTRYERHV